MNQQSVPLAYPPGVGLIMLSMVFAQVGLPIEGIGLVLGVDKLIDMNRIAPLEELPMRK